MAPDGSPVAVLDAIDERRLDLFAAVVEHGVAGHHAEQRGLRGAERHGEGGREIIVDAKPAGIFGDDRHAHIAGQPHRHEVAGMLDAEAQGRGSGGRTSLVVFRAPFRHARALTNANRAVDDDTGGIVAVVERGRVNQRAERGSGLPTCLRGAIELALREAEAARDGKHPAGVWVHGHERAAHLGDLLQRPLALKAVVGRCRRPVIGRPRHARRNIDNVARLQHRADRTRRSAKAVADLRPRPLHFIVGDDAGIARLLQSAGLGSARP